MHAYDWLKSHFTRRMAGPDTAAETVLVDAAIRQPEAVVAAENELPQVFHFRRKPTPILDATAGNS